MKTGSKFGAWFSVLALSAALVGTCVAAQRPSKDNPRASQRNEQRQAPAQKNNRPPDAYRGERQQQRQERQQRTAPNYRPQGRTDSREYRPQNRMDSSRTRPEYNQNRADSQRPNYNQNQNRPPERRFQDRSPQEQRDLARRENQLNRLPPQQRQELQSRAQTWNQLTPAQQAHIKNDIVPKWQQMSPERQKAIQNRLGVLRNMPESARNRHLSDPNFTRGMSQEDKEMLRDLSHQHVGAPDHPEEQ